MDTATTIANALSRSILICGKDWLTLEEAAIWIGKSVRSLRDSYPEMGITPRKRGQKLYFSKADLDTWMASGEVTGKSEVREIADQILSTFKTRKPR